MPLKTIIKRARVKLHDTDGITYDDDTLVDVANDGIRFIRRSIAQIQPELLLSTVSGTLSAGVSKIELPQRPLTIIEVAAGDRVRETIVTYNSQKIYHNRTKIWHNTTPLYSKQTTLYYAKQTLISTNLRHIMNRTDSGSPEAFYRTGLKTINLFPVPNKTTAYTIHTIDDIDELTMSDNSPLINDFDDFLVEYIVTRLAIDNEYDMSQEQSIMANIFVQIQQVIAPPPPGLTVSGYWDTAYDGGDYGGRLT